MLLQCSQATDGPSSKNCALLQLWIWKCISCEASPDSPSPLFHLAAWLRDRIDSRQLRAKIAFLEEELERMEADPAPVHEQVNDGEFQKTKLKLADQFLGKGAW
jgi:hypothetical protein